MATTQTETSMATAMGLLY